jgi:CheY-like chemotaxis protein
VLAFPTQPRVHALVAEDNQVNQRLVVRMLEKIGCRADLAGDGREAVEMAQRARYDVIIMDCFMPEMDGYQATAEIRRLQSEAGVLRVPIIALTANALPADRERCLAAGMDDYLSKPVRKEDLQAALERWPAIQNALLTTPPSTRSAAPVVADERGLAT